MFELFIELTHNKALYSVNKRNKVNRDHDWRWQGGGGARVGARPGASNNE